MIDIRDGQNLCRSAASLGGLDYRRHRGSVGVEQAILLAMGLSLLDHVRRGYRASNAVIGRTI